MNKFNVKSNRQFSQVEYEGENIEEKINRLYTTNQPIGDEIASARIYQKRKDGVADEYNVRADKWDIALAAMDEINKSKIAAANAYTEETEPIEPTEPKE